MRQASAAEPNADETDPVLSAARAAPPAAAIFGGYRKANPGAPVHACGTNEHCLDTLVLAWPVIR